MRTSRATLLMLLGACVQDGGPDPRPVCDGTASLSVLQGTLSGDVPLEVILTQSGGDTAWLRLRWSDDGTTWHDATVIGETADLLPTPEGTSVSLAWDTVADLGNGRTEGLSVALIPYSTPPSTCGTWDKVVVDGLTVENTEIPTPSCRIEAEIIDTAQEGDVIVRYTTFHPDGATVDVDPYWSTGSSLVAIDPARDRDCDGDGVDDDSTVGILASDVGVDHCFVWDSDASGEIASDTEVTLTLDCRSGTAVDDSAVIGPFAVDNDPTPGPGELQITEIMPSSSRAKGTWLELVSLSGHRLDLEGLQVRRYSSSGSLAATFTVSVPSQRLWVEPGAYVVFGGSSDTAQTGCVSPDATWGTFTLNMNSSVEVWSGEGEVTSLSFLFAGGWLFDEDVSFALDPSFYGTADATELASWCTQDNALTCAAIDEPGVYGTPGGLNESCN